MERKSNKNVKKDGGFEKLMSLLFNAFYGGICLVAGASDHTVQKLIVISNKFPRTFDSILLSYVIDAY